MGKDSPEVLMEGTNVTWNVNFRKLCNRCKVLSSSNRKESLIGNYGLIGLVAVMAKLIGEGWQNLPVMYEIHEKISSKQTYF